MKKLTALFLVVLTFSLQSFAAVVSDNDGSAFISKAEFEALKADFKSQIDNYNTSIDEKIDGAIAAYLAGIKINTATAKKPMFIDIYGETPTFHNADSYNKTYVDTKANIIWGSYNLAIKAYNLSHRGTMANGAFLMEYDWEFPASKFALLHKLKWDKDNEEWLFSSVAEDVAINWKWVTHQDSYNIAPGANPFIHWAWNGVRNYIGIIPKTTSVNMGTRGTQYNAWAESSNTSRSYDEVNTSTTPSWSTGSWNTALTCDAGKWTEIDEGEWKNTIGHLWVNDEDQAIERKFDLTSDEIHYITVESISDFKAKTNTVTNAVQGDYSEPKYVTSELTWKDVYAVALHGYKGSSTYNVLSRKTRLKPNEVKYVIKSGLKEPMKLHLYQAPLFDRVEKDAEALQFEITLLKKDGYGDATIYFSKKTWANSNHKPADADIVKIYKGDDETALDSISLKVGEKTKIRIKDLKRDDLLFFSLVPESGNKTKVDSFANCYYFYS